MNYDLNSSDSQLWKKLQQAELVQDDISIEPTSDTPWYIRTMQGFAGWVAAFFLLAFFGTVFSWIFDRESSLVLITIGFVGNAIAFAMFKTKHRNEFLYQLGLVVNLCGQLMVAWGIYEAIHSFDAQYFFILFIYQSILVASINDFLSRVLTTWFAMIALFACFSRMGVFNISTALASGIFAMVWLKDIKWGKQKNLWEPVGYGLALSLLQFSGQLLFGEGQGSWFQSEQAVWINHYSFWLSKIFIAVVFIHLLVALAKQYRIEWLSQTGLLVIVAGILLVFMGYFVTGANGALLLLLIGFMKQRRILISLGVLALLSFISWYYYNLGLTLLSKSIILMTFGLCFFVGFYLLSVLTDGKKISLDNLKQKYQLDLTKWIAIVSMLVILVGINFNIYKKEQILNQGQIVLLQLAPVDPRSLMQGDYMRLRFSIEATVLEKNEITDQYLSNQDGYFIVNLDADKVATFDKIDNGSPLTNNQVKMQFRVRHGQLRLATHAFFFEEGTGDEYEKARYGEFRVDPSGELLLNNLRGESFNILGFNRPNQ